MASYVALSLAVAVLGLGFLDARYDLRRDQKILTSMLHSDQGFELRGQSGAVARVVPTAAGATFVATGLQQAPDAHTYQLWLMRDQQPVSAGTFEASEGLVILEMERSLEGFDRAAVTIEPEGGSREPTSPPVIQSA